MSQGMAACLAVLASCICSSQAFLNPSSFSSSSLLPPPCAPLRSRGSSMMAAGQSALIIQNKGGGHGEIGYHLALKLVKEKGLQVTLLNDKYDDQKQPFKSYGDLTGAGVDILSADLGSADVKSLLSGRSFHYVFDNFAKSSEALPPFLDLARAWPLQVYVFVSSGGMYQVEDSFPLLEDSPVALNEPRKIELAIEASGLPYTFFRPQYIYGPLTSKRDYLDWFFHRLVRDKPLPLPLHGDQFTTLTHVEDVASLLAAVVDNPQALRQVFNCASDRCITFKGVVGVAGNAMGRKDAKEAIVLYDPAERKADLPKGWWPFRNTHFNVSPEKAKRLLGWVPAHDLAKDLEEYYRGYVAAGLDKKEMSFEVDEKILG
uniref:NAD(P)-binding domain-containing protein n=1 Tax=Nannochloropsis gaditana (strain CCMP526) TaxID=1093141 RepID=I2CPE2_NANGC